MSSDRLGNALSAWYHVYTVCYKSDKWYYITELPADYHQTQGKYNKLQCLHRHTFWITSKIGKKTSVS